MKKKRALAPRVRRAPERLSSTTTPSRRSPPMSSRISVFASSSTLPALVIRSTRYLDMLLPTACCDEVDPYSILESHGCLLRRPQKENRRSRRKARNEKERGRPSVRGEPLFSQALREEVSPRKLAFARQSTRPKPEDRRVCQQTAGSRPQGAALRQAPPEMRVPQSTGGIEGEQIYSLPRSQTDGVHQKKRAATMVFATSCPSGLTRKKEGFVPFH